jgi:hypothetical protein
VTVAGHDGRVQADLEWDLSPALSVGPWAVDVSTDGTQARLCDVATLEDLREIHSWSPTFTLRFRDGTSRDVVVRRPADDGTIALSDVGIAIPAEAAAPVAEDPGGPLPEPEPVAETTAWLHEHGFGTREHSRSGHSSGGRTFGRADGWRVRYSCVLGTWTLELSPPAHAGFTTLHTDQTTTWRATLQDVIGDPGFAP